MAKGRTNKKGGRKTIDEGQKKEGSYQYSTIMHDGADKKQKVKLEIEVSYD